MIEKGRHFIFVVFRNALKFVEQAQNWREGRKAVCIMTKPTDNI